MGWEGTARKEEEVTKRVSELCTKCEWLCLFQADSHLRLTLAAFLVATSAILLGLSKGGRLGGGTWAVEWLVWLRSFGWRTFRPIVVLEVNTVGTAHCAAKKSAPNLLVRSSSLLVPAYLFFPALADTSSAQLTKTP